MKKLIYCISLLLVIGISSCSDTTSYAELLDDENFNVNRFLADQRVIASIPADTVFEVGPDAPYYQMDDEGNIYMQVLNAGSGPMATDNQLIYFRFTRYNIAYYGTDNWDVTEGNETTMEYGSTSFRFGNYSLESSYQWGTAIQLPLSYLPLNCEVNLVVKSQYGWTEEISYVNPFLYHLRYYKSQI
ncbi:MAG: DUF4827 domain-containing protein [Bacteroidales bacterium]|nr:DUF4827 domain-containing protein [Bacteroidales bacterium]